MQQKKKPFRYSFGKLLITLKIALKTVQAQSTYRYISGILILVSLHEVPEHSERSLHSHVLYFDIAKSTHIFQLLLSDGETSLKL